MARLLERRIERYKKLIESGDEAFKAMGVQKLISNTNSGDAKVKRQAINFLTLHLFAPSNTKERYRIRQTLIGILRSDDEESAKEVLYSFFELHKIEGSYINHINWAAKMHQLEAVREEARLITKWIAQIRAKNCDGGKSWKRRFSQK